MTGSTAMDHRRLEAEEWPERYVTGRLSAEDAAAFEEHYLGCPECIERVEAAERLQRGLARVAVEEAAGAAATLRVGWLAALDRLARSRAGAVLVASLLMAALVASWLALTESRRLRGQLGEANAALARGAEAGEGRAAELAAELAELHRRLAVGEAEHAAALAAEREERRALAEELHAERRPRINLPVVALTAFRDAGAEPVAELVLPAEPGWVALWLEPGGEDFPSYRATLRRADGDTAWTGEGLALNALGAAVVSFHSESLAPGEYEVVLVGVTPGGEAAPAGRFRLRVRREQGPG